MYRSHVLIFLLDQEDQSQLLLLFPKARRLALHSIRLFYHGSQVTCLFMVFEIAGGIPSRDSYLGVRIENEGIFYYGWIRLIFPGSYEHFDETGYLKIKEFAVESSGATAITAGVGRSVAKSEYPVSITALSSHTITVEAREVAGMLCTFQSSIDLKEWSDDLIVFSTQERILAETL